jgi:hypothetical protein
MTVGSVVTIVLYLLYNFICNKRQRRLIKHEPARTCTQTGVPFYTLVRGSILGCDDCNLIPINQLTRRHITEDPNLYLHSCGYGELTSHYLLFPSTYAPHQESEYTGQTDPSVNVSDVNSVGGRFEPRP